MGFYLLADFFIRITDILTGALQRHVPDGRLLFVQNYC
jgi:hypothetical protein